MDAFVRMLRQQVLDTEAALETARWSGDQAAVDMYDARLLDLLDRGTANNVDAGSWLTAELHPETIGGW